MRVVGGVLLLSISTALADDAITVRKREWFRPEEEPLLHIDPTWRPHRALEGAEDITRATYSIGNTLVVLERSAWSDSTGFVGEGKVPATGITGDGWGVTLRLSRNLGPLRVGGYASYQALDTRLLRSSYVDVGVSVGRTFKLSKWMTAWVALSVGRRRWLGDIPLLSEKSDDTLMLSIGTTFR